MKMTSSVRALRAITLAVCLTGVVSAAELQPFPTKGKVLQRLAAFDNPEGAIFSADGKFVFISNSADLGNATIGLRWVHNAGYISKLVVQPDGTLKMVTEKLVAGLTGPLGMAVNPVATGKFPAGTIFVAEAWSHLAEADGSEPRDPKFLDPKLVAFSEDGKILGAIRLGAGTPAARKAGVIGVMNNAIAFDKSGNLYSADTGTTVIKYATPLVTRGGGVYEFPHTSLDALADGKDAPLHYVPFPEGGPDGVEQGPDGLIHVNTVGLAAGLKDPAGGGMYKLSAADFAAGRLPAPFRTGMGGLDGLTFANDKRLDTEVKDSNLIIVTPPGGSASYSLAFDSAIKFAGPADIATRKLADGSILLVVPELSATAANTRRDVVSVIRLPAEF